MSLPTGGEGENVHKEPSPETRIPYVVGPCRHDKECPLQPGERCCFSHKVSLEMADLTCLQFYESDRRSHLSLSLCGSSPWLAVKYFSLR